MDSDIFTNIFLPRRARGQLLPQVAVCEFSWHSKFFGDSVTDDAEEITTDGGEDVAFSTSV